jgi:hypothetical protein
MARNFALEGDGLFTILPALRKIGGEAPVVLKESHVLESPASAATGLASPIFVIPVARVLRGRWKSMKRIFLLVVFVLASFVEGQTPNPKQQFPVFDAASGGFSQGPNLKEYGLKPITVVYPNFMWQRNKVPDATSLPDKSRIIAFAQLAGQTSNILTIDIEHWPLTGDPTTVSDSVQKYRTVINWFKVSAGPGLKIGYYGVAPIRDYWDVVPQGKGSPRYLTWQKQNDAVAPIAQLADVLFPSIYTFYDDRKGWQTYAIAQIQEARRYAGGKPVYVFLWPQYHESNKVLGNTFLPGSYWRMELETARQYADGVVIWCCSSRQKWDDNAPWWLETQKVLQEIKMGQP